MNDNCSATWPHLIDDYPEALVRIATLRGDGQHHLLFGWVELFPFEMRVPKGWTAGDKPWRVPGTSNWTCSFSATPIETSKTLEWYAAAFIGEVPLNVRDPSIGKARVSNVGPEPAIGGFCTPVDAPFTYRWHDGPRIHRLVALSPPPEPVRSVGKRSEARVWLEEHLGFDPFRYEEWLCGLALVAPDPVCSAVHLSPGAIGEDGSETLRVCIVPRRSPARGVADMSGLSLHVAENRLGSWSSVKTLQVNPEGRATLSYPQMMGSVAYALVCSKRGLLRLVEPMNWIRQVRGEMMAIPGSVRVQVPSGGKRKLGKAYDTAQRAHNRGFHAGELIPEETWARLIRLKFRSEARVEREQAPQQVFGVIDKAAASEAEIQEKRAEAENFVIRLVNQARKRIVFVDAFFGVREFRLFALRNQQSTPVRVLTGMPAMKIGIGPFPGFQVQQGASFAADLREIENTPGVCAPQVRVMPQDSPIIHDRYLVIDNSVWHFGPSFNEIGARVGVATKLPDPISVRRFISKVWCRSTPLGELSRKAQSVS